MILFVFLESCRILKTYYWVTEELLAVTEAGGVDAYTYFV